MLATVTVGGGFAQGGGHAPFSSKYGLAADNILEYKVVTADGRLVVANSQANTDLFLALRGGGGGTLGVVVEATMNAWPSPKIAVRVTIRGCYEAEYLRWPNGGSRPKTVKTPAAFLHRQHICTTNFRA